VSHTCLTIVESMARWMESSWSMELCRREREKNLRGRSWAEVRVNEKENSRAPHPSVTLSLELIVLKEMSKLRGEREAFGRKSQRAEAVEVATLLEGRDAGRKRPGEIPTTIRSTPHH
jgi:hypothetical protein